MQYTQFVVHNKACTIKSNKFVKIQYKEKNLPKTVSSYTSYFF